LSVKNFLVVIAFFIITILTKKIPVVSSISSFSILVNRAGHYQQKNAHQTRLTHEPMETGVKPCWALNTDNFLRSNRPNRIRQIFSPQFLWTSAFLVCVLLAKKFAKLFSSFFKAVFHHDNIFQII